MSTVENCDMIEAARDAEEHRERQQHQFDVSKYYCVVCGLSAQYIMDEQRYVCDAVPKRRLRLLNFGDR